MLNSNYKKKLVLLVVTKGLIMQRLSTSRIILGGVSPGMQRGLKVVTTSFIRATAMTATCSEARSSISSSVFSPRPVASGGKVLKKNGLNGLTTRSDHAYAAVPSGATEETPKQKFKLTLDTINPYVKNMEYAVRGKMPQEAAKIEAAIKKVGFGWHGSLFGNSINPIK